MVVVLLGRLHDVDGRGRVLRLGLALDHRLDPGDLGVATALDDRDGEGRVRFDQERGPDAEVVVGRVGQDPPLQRMTPTRSVKVSPKRSYGSDSTISVSIVQPGTYSGRAPTTPSGSWTSTLSTGRPSQP